MAKQSFLFFVSYGFLLLVPSSAIEANIAINGNSKIGGNVIITCSWTLGHNEDLRTVQVRSLPVPSGSEHPYYYQFTIGHSSATIGDQSNVRMSADNLDANNNRAVVRITNVQCADEGNYSCYFTTSIANQPTFKTDRFSYLTVAGAHEPMVKLAPRNLHLTVKYYFQYEWTPITGTCSANLGEPVHSASFLWRLHYGDETQDIAAGDSRLSPVVADTDHICPGYMKQSFRLTSGTMPDAWAISCFVKNPLVNVTRGPCRNGETVECSKSADIFFITKPNLKNTIIGLLMAVVEFAVAIVFLVIAKRFIENLKPTPQPKPAPKPMKPIAPIEEPESYEGASDVIEEREDYEEESAVSGVSSVDA